MSSVIIVPVIQENGATSYRAVSPAGQFEGATAGQALDAMRAQHPASGTTVVVVQSMLADEFFPEVQRSRLAELMQRWRAARDCGIPLADEEQRELDALIGAEFEAATRRSAQLLKEAGA